MSSILVVEDEEKVRELFVQFLGQQGFDVAQASHGQQALTLTGKRAFDLVVMDIKMPKLDGLAAMKAIRISAPATKVLFITGYSIHEDVEQVLQPGMIECLRKPFTFEQLTATIHRLLADNASNTPAENTPAES